MTIKHTLIALAAIAPMLASVPAHGAQTYMKSSRLEAVRMPPLPWHNQDPAVAVYRNARAALNDSNFKRAASLFEEIISKYPRSTYAPDAYYWGAFAYYSAKDYKPAETLLLRQKQLHPRAATASDAASLLVRVRGQLATSGDPDAAISVARRAGEVAT